MATIYRDGLGYFFVLCVISITNSVLLKVGSDMNSPYFNFFGLLQRVVQAILASRIVISVRKALRSSSEQFMVSDPLGNAASGGSSNAEGNGKHTSASAVMIHTSTYTRRDVDDMIEMDWAPYEKRAYPPRSPSRIGVVKYVRNFGWTYPSRFFARIPEILEKSSWPFLPEVGLKSFFVQVDGLIGDGQPEKCLVSESASSNFTFCAA